MKSFLVKFILLLCVPIISLVDAGKEFLHYCKAGANKKYYDVKLFHVLIEICMFPIVFLSYCFKYAKQVVFLSWLSMLFFSSCYTEKTAQKRIIKVQSTFPNVMAKNCATFYPTKDSTSTTTIYTTGKTDTLIAYEWLNCDTIINQPTKYIDRTIKVPYIKAIKQVDTFTKTLYKSVENTAKVKTLEHEINESKSIISVFEHRIKKLNTANYILMIALFSIIIFHLIKIYINAKKTIL